MIRERALEAYESYRQVLPTIKTVRAENWVAERFDMEANGPVLWETEWAGEVEVDDISLWIEVNSDIVAYLMRRCPSCGAIQRGLEVKDLASLGKALTLFPNHCFSCGGGG